MPHSLRHRFPALLWVIAVLWAATSIARAQEEVPFVTSPDNVTLEMLRMADVGPGDHVIDLGSGDGRIVILAAKRFGASGLGVEIAQVAGLWCGEGLLRDASLDLSQRYQEFEGTLRHRERSRPVAGRIEGNTLRAQGGKAGELVLQVQGGQLRILAAGGPLALAQGMAFHRAAGGRCV